MSLQKKHQHWCDVAGHYWECDGYALRTFSGKISWSECVCICGISMSTGNHSDCPVELLPCLDHIATPLLLAPGRGPLADP
jgi:hypothetical protein